MEFKRISDTIGYVADTTSAEKILHDHEVATTTRYVMYYNNGLGKGEW